MIRNSVVQETGEMNAPTVKSENVGIRRAGNPETKLN
jgi:hypothetical protein